MRHVNEVIREAQKKSILPLRLHDVEWMMENYLPKCCSSDDIHFDRPKCVESLNGIFQKHSHSLESDLLGAGQFTFGPTPKPPFFSVRPVGDRSGERIDSRDSSVSSRSRQRSSTPLEKDVTESSTPESSVVSSVVVVEKDIGSKMLAEGRGESSRARYQERVKILDLEALVCK